MVAGVGPGGQRVRSDPRLLPAGPPGEPGASFRCGAFLLRQHALREHHSGRRAGPLSRRSRPGAAAEEPDPLERPGHGGAGQQLRPRHRRPHLDLRLARHPGGSGLQPLFPRGLWRSARGFGLFPGARLAGRLLARLPGGTAQRKAPRELPSRAARTTGPVLVPASLADAGFLAVSDGLDGAGADQRHLPGALHALLGEAGAAPANAAQGLGLPGRWRDRRAGIHRRPAYRRQREAGQPDLRGQLQPSAAGRSSARQRQGDPGTRGGLRRVGLERHQGDLGERLGPAPRPRPVRPAGPAHERVPGRRLPDLRGPGRRLHPQGVLRQIPRTTGPGGRSERRTTAQAAPRRPRSRQSLQRLPARLPAHRLAHRDPGQDHQGLWVRRGRRGPQRHPPAEKAQ